MAILLALQGPEPGRRYTLKTPSSILGRQLDSTVCLPAKAVSRQHAQIFLQDGAWYIEDLESSNGTFYNGTRMSPRLPQPLNERDVLQVGPYVLALRPEPTQMSKEESLVIRDQVSAVSFDSSVYEQAPAKKLEVVLDIAQHLARTLDMEELLNKLLDKLMRLFPQADRSMVLLCEDDSLVVRAQRVRREEEPSLHTYSRTVVQRALDEGIGILSEDVQADARFQSSSTLTSLDLHSLLCIPLITPDGRRYGVIQVDRFRHGLPFNTADLQLLTTVCYQVSIALDNAALHAELLREERLRQELQMAREIQEGFLPSEFDDFSKDGFELYACVHPAREVSGDLYDFYRLPDGRLTFFVGDVSGKGMPAALFMVAVRTLSRHLAKTGDSPAETLARLNDSLSADNPSGMFVTLAHGLFTPTTGALVLASGGHHRPLLRRAIGVVDEVTQRSGRLLGYEGMDLKLSDTHLTLEPGELLIFYTDGVTEARPPGGKTLFGVERLKEVVMQFEPELSLPACAEMVHNAVHRFSGIKELQDDLTLFLLRRLPLAES